MFLKLKRTPGLYLVGFMGAGKSTVGRALAEELGWRFCDIDSEIEREQGVSISELFLEHGEQVFRELETEAIRRHVNLIRAGTPGVVALGGGAFVQPRNWEILENNGVTIWLDCPFDVLCQRLDGDDTRPLARDRERLAQLYEDRRDLYRRADFRLEVSDIDVTLVVRRILDLPIF
jgi:shikimate kinase